VWKVVLLRTRLRFASLGQAVKGGGKDALHMCLTKLIKSVILIDLKSNIELLYLI